VRLEPAESLPEIDVPDFEPGRVSQQSMPAEDRAESDAGAVGDGELVVAEGDAALLLGESEEPLVDVRPL